MTSVDGWGIQPECSGSGPLRSGYRGRNRRKLRRNTHRLSPRRDSQKNPGRQQRRHSTGGALNLGSTAAGQAAEYAVYAGYQLAGDGFDDVGGSITAAFDNMGYEP